MCVLLLWLIAASRSQNHATARFKLGWPKPFTCECLSQLWCQRGSDFDSAYSNGAASGASKFYSSTSNSGLNRDIECPQLDRLREIDRFRGRTLSLQRIFHPGRCRFHQPAELGLKQTHLLLHFPSNFAIAEVPFYSRTQPRDVL